VKLACLLARFITFSHAPSALLFFSQTGIPVHVKLQMPTLSVHNSTFTDGDQGSIMSRAGKNQHGDTTIMASSAVDTIEQDEPFAQQKYYYLI
jgi:hypothetical protein